MSSVLDDSSSAADADAQEVANVDNTNKPRNPLVCALLTDLYQLTMAYAYWKNGRHNDPAVFELFFRKNPFGGEYTVFAGLDECLKYLVHFQFTPDDITYLRQQGPLSHCEPEFWDYLATLTTSEVELWAMPEGRVAFPRVPLIIVQAPLAVGQLLETTLLTLVNYPSLITTNATRMVRAAQGKSSEATAAMHYEDGDDRSGVGVVPSQCTRTPVCVEFGLRRAQGPDGGISASHYAHLGGFVATSNVLAGKLSGIPLSGTHAHAFVQSFSSLREVEQVTIHHISSSTSAKSGDTTHDKNAKQIQLLTRALDYRREFANLYDPAFGQTHEGELAAFIAYGAAFPRQFLCLIDTYDTLNSGLLNFVVVACVLHDDGGYMPVGVRLDSGDLADLSLECAKVFARHARERPFFDQLSIVASNDINEDLLYRFNKQGHAITAYGIGTNLVTCERQPALGCVYKLVEIAGQPKIKLSEDLGKVLIPGKKRAYRLYGKDGRPILDILTSQEEPSPQVGHRILCLHPFDPQKRVAVTPSRVESLLTCVFSRGRVVTGNSGSRSSSPATSLEQARRALAEELAILQPEIFRHENPKPYKVSLSPQLYGFLQDMWQKESPIVELS